MTLRTFGRILVVLIILVLQATWTSGKVRPIKPGCRYEGRRYQEGMAVSTSEPCLQCRCIEGALRCRLRVCPRLPSPPPTGCHVRSPEENVCCAELICGGSHDTENMLRRSNVRIDEEMENEDSLQNSHSEGCVYEGVRYGPGSAMMGSRRCEYCYCISGARRCIRPKCLLPLPGCTPLYAPHSCCPVAYNCTHVHASTLAPISGNGCRVDEREYEEGEMVRDIEWKAACDNCFCAMGAVRCVPLACAPPLQGCSPIVREGQCCPSTYNCSGSIEVKATQNYASYAFISKDYAKFRKETNFFPAVDQTTNLSVEGRGHRVVEERIDTSTIEYEEETSFATDSTSLPSTYETDIMDNEILVETVDYTKFGFEIASTTPISLEELTSNTETTMFESTSLNNDDVTSTMLPKTIVPESAITEDFTTTPSMDSVSELTTLPFELNAYDSMNQTYKDDEQGINVIERNSGLASSTNLTSDVKDEDFECTNTMIESISNVTEASVKGPVTKPSSTILMPDDILVMNVTVKTNVSVSHIQGVTINPIRSIPPDVEAILNITHREKGEEYEYDYSEPTLPPSLPNVRIIPFVAADALVKDKAVSSAVTGYPSGSVVVPPELRPTGTSGFYDIVTQENRFSPPVETEGGFVPREPPYFDASYHSTDLNLEIGTGVTVVPAPITNPHRKNDVSSCLFENLEHRHGEILPSSGICVICMCYYGEVVCSTEKCPPLKIGCRRINTEEECCGKVVCVEAEESPTVVLDRADATAMQHQPIVPSDPFRDVIKTEPAPDLPSLIEDMIPYLVEHGITTPRGSSSTTTLKPIQASGSNHPQHTNFDYIEKLPLIRPPFDYREDSNEEHLLITQNKYSVNQDAHHTKESMPLTYNPKDPDQKIEAGFESTQEIAAFDYDHITLTRLDYTTSKQNDSLLPEHTTESYLKKSRNSTNINVEHTTGTKNVEVGVKTSEIKDLSSSTSEVSSIEFEEEPIFSLDSVLDLLFSSDSMTTRRSSESTRIMEVSSSSTSGSSEDRKVGGTFAPVTSKGPGKHKVETKADVETTSKVLDNEIPMSVASLLKLAGCNIYGRMYRVGRIITELSGPCLECRCTEIGVQCKQLEC